MPAPAPVSTPRTGRALAGHPAKAGWIAYPPPTDFHSATPVGDGVILIGNWGYTKARRPGSTQVLALDLATFAVTVVPTSGTPPGHRR